MSQKLKMDFKTALDTTYSVTLPMYRDDITSEMIADFMDYIISSGIIVSTKGVLISKESAFYITETQEELY